MDFFFNWNLIVLAFIVAGIGFVGTAVFFSNRRSISNVSLFCFSLVTMVWSVANFVFAKSLIPELQLELTRTIIVLGVWHAFFFFQLCYVFPAEQKPLGRWYWYGLLPMAVLISILNVTPFTLQNVGTPSNPEVLNFPGIVAFGVFVTALVLAGIAVLIQKTIRSKGIERQQILIVTLGTLLTFGLILVFNVVFPAVLNRPDFIPYSALFIFPFLGFTAYSILALRLFDVKAITVSILLFFLAASNIMGVVYSETTTELLFNIFKFVFILILGFFLIRSVIREVKQREQLEKLTKELSRANKRLRKLDKAKSEFVSIASHQLRSPLTAMRGYASMLLEGSYGKLPQKAAPIVERIADSGKNMSLLVEDYLNVSRIESGNMKYNLDDFNLVDETKRVVDDKRQEAMRNGLLLMYKTNVKSDGIVHADKSKVIQILHNLINNAIKYTPKGSITVYVQDDTDKHMLHIDVSDTGVGMTAEETHSIFNKFERAADASKVNTSGTGLGLFVAKSMTEHMGGSVTASSDGKNKGSTFRLTLPLAQ